ncbi:MAG: outer membrane beta-barrel protein [Acidobacteriota bacterium]|nr:outer membrane beta-barrel protein [Acidobacteriota bacterium]
MFQRMFTVVCLVALAAAPAAAFDFNLAVGADFSGDFDAGNISVSADTGYTLGLELAFKIPLIEAGVGLEYGFSREAKDVDIEASYYQLYAIGRFFIGPAYIAGRFGYADVSFSEALDGSTDGGSWGLGGGVELFGKLKVEILFNSLGSDFSYEGWTLRLLYTF